MNKLITNLLITTTSNVVAGLILILMGTLVIGNYEVIIYNSEGVAVSNLNELTKLGEWFGWLVLFLGIDSIFGNKISKWLTEKIIAPILNPIIKGIVGKEKLEKLRARFNKEKTNEQEK